MESMYIECWHVHWCGPLISYVELLLTGREQAGLRRPQCGHVNQADRIAELVNEWRLERGYTLLRGVKSFLPGTCLACYDKAPACWLPFLILP